MGPILTDARDGRSDEMCFPCFPSRLSSPPESLQRITPVMDSSSRRLLSGSPRLSARDQQNVSSDPERSSGQYVTFVWHPGPSPS